jgi:hypothetical protein
MKRASRRPGRHCSNWRADSAASRTPSAAKTDSGPSRSTTPRPIAQHTDGKVSINNLTATRDRDGSVTFNFGGADDRPNLLPLVDVVLAGGQLGALNARAGQRDGQRRRR